MLVSMTPNDEVKTIHASLNDGSLRKWEFEPYTEQGKIELTDQDYATIQSIKGNTVKFNQLVQNGNFADTSIWDRNSGATFSVSNNVVTITPSTNNYSGIRQNITSLIKDHKYIATVSLQTNGSETWRFGLAKSVSPYPYLIYVDSSNVSTWQNLSFVWTYDESQDIRFTLYKLTANGSAISAKNAMLIDLTAIFGSGNEPSTVSDFETWLSNNIGLLPYYAYTPGTLIPFMGTGLKTTGKNLCSVNTGNNIVLVPVEYGKTYTFSIRNRGNCGFNLKKNSNSGEVIVTGFATSSSPLYATFTADDNYNLFLNGFGNDGYTFSNSAYDYQLELGSSASEYEPYNSNTLSLPISTYFPTGMKEARTVYDEISDKAYTKIKQVVIDNATAYSTNYGRTNGDIVRGFAFGDVKAPANNNTVANILSVVGSMSANGLYNSTQSGIAVNVAGRLDICIAGITTSEALSTYLSNNPLTVYYELATPTSQDISLDLTYPIYNNGTEQILPVNGSTPTTSPMVATIEYPDRTEDVDFLYKQTTFESNIPQFSLVCKNQELPMTLEDGKLICECDSSITNESGFFDCKVKMQDLDSVAYSQKIQLHVERGIND